jgi:hypothetical protein
MVACGGSGNKSDGGGGIGGIGGLGGGAGSSDAGIDRTITGAGGTAGSATGGTGGTGGNPLAFCDGVAPKPAAVDGAVGNSLISDFSSDPPVVWGPYDPSTSPVYGGRYANEPLTEEVDSATGRWHIRGTIETQKGFGLWFGCAQGGSGYMGCTIDLSRYAGIQFTVRGNVGPSGRMGLSLGRAQNDVPKSDGCGSCAADADAGVSCNGPGVQFDVPNDGADHVIVVTWEMFKGGHPYDRLDPHQITGDYFFFNPPGFELDGGVPDGGDAATNFDAASIADAAAIVDAAVGAAVDGSVDPDAGEAGTNPDAGPPRPSYSPDIYVDDVQLVAY